MLNCCKHQKTKGLKKFDQYICRVLFDLRKSINKYLVKNCHRTRRIIYEILGWYGLFGIISAYILISFTAIQANNATYQILNATGGVGLAVFTLYKKAYQSTATHSIWAIIAVIALVRIFFFQ